MASREKDYFGWTIEQVALLRAGRLNEIDAAHVADAIEELGNIQKRELTARLTVLLTDLLKWQLQPDRRDRNWRLAIAEHRDRVLEHLDANVSLRGQLADTVPPAWRAGLRTAQSETELDLDLFPRANPWTVDQILSAAFYPE